MPNTSEAHPITKEMISLTKELQAIPELETFHLGGGTALTISFSHRISDDIDLISSKSYSKEEIKALITTISNHFGDRVKGKISLNDQGGTPDNLLFIRLYIEPEPSKDPIKVELIQNVYCKGLEPETKDGIRLIPLELISVFKLAAANDRAANKDIYDMYFLTKGSEAALYNICRDFDQYKSHILANPEKVSLFDQRINETPLLTDPSPLRTFEDKKLQSLESPKLPMHSNHNVVPINGNSPIRVAQSQYRMKINALYGRLGVPRPKPRGMGS